MPQINWLAVIAAALSMFAIGGLWYSPMLFAKPWQKAAGLSDDTLKSGSPPLIFGIAFLLSLLMAANLAFFLAGVTDLGAALAYSIAAGLGWAALGLSVVALFERRPLAYHLINGGYLTVAFVVMGLILAVWK